MGSAVLTDQRLAEANWRSWRQRLKIADWREKEKKSHTRLMPTNPGRWQRMPRAHNHHPTTKPRLLLNIQAATNRPRHRNVLDTTKKQKVMTKEKVMGSCEQACDGAEHPPSWDGRNRLEFEDTSAIQRPRSDWRRHLVGGRNYKGDSANQILEDVGGSRFQRARTRWGRTRAHSTMLPATK